MDPEAYFHIRATRAISDKFGNHVPECWQHMCVIIFCCFNCFDTHGHIWVQMHGLAARCVANCRVGVQHSEWDGLKLSRCWVNPTVGRVVGNNWPLLAQSNSGCILTNDHQLHYKHLVRALLITWWMIFIMDLPLKTVTRSREGPRKFPTQEGNKVDKT